MNKKNVVMLITLLFMVSITSTVIGTIPITKADNYQPQDASTEIGLYFNQTYLEVGDDFNMTCYLNPGGETVTAWYVWNLTYNYETLGMVNATGQWIFGFWDTGFDDSGSWDNTTGNISGPQSFDVGGTSDNHTAFVSNFTANTPGKLYLNFSADGIYSSTGVQISDAGGAVTNHTVNATIMIYPQDATIFTATTWNHTAINLSWTQNPQNDNVTICGKAGSYPSGPADSVLYNGSNLTYNHTSLNNCTTYFYRAWSYNETSGLHSYEYDSATATTSCYTNISFAGINPTNNTKITNCTYSQTVNVTILNSQGRTCLYWINASDGSTASGTVANSSVSLALSSLSHNTTYWWNVTASEQGGTQDSTQAHYHFRTGEGGGSSPVGSAPYPNGITDVPISPLNFAATVTDADGDPTNVSFFLSDGTFLGNHNMTYSGNTANVTYTTALAYNTTYQWYALLNDTGGCGTSTRYPSSGYLSFITQNQIVTLTKEWAVYSNNTLQMWINTTNVGEADLTNGYINETWDYDYLTLVGANWTADGTDAGRYNITTLNQGDTAWLTMFFSLRTPAPNGTSFSDTAKVIFNGTTLNTFTPTTLPTICYYATKEMNTSIKWNTTSVTFWVNITNCGDFYLNFTRLNESYPVNLTYDYSNYAPNATNETFNITQIAPGATNTTLIRMNKTSGDWINGTRIWNNITIHSNQTTGDTAFNNSWYVGARTTQLRVIYNTIYYDVLGTSNSVFQIIGIALIIGALLGVIMVFYIKQKNQW